MSFLGVACSLYHNDASQLRLADAVDYGALFQHNFTFKYLNIVILANMSQRPVWQAI